MEPRHRDPARAIATVGRRASVYETIPGRLAAIARWYRPAMFGLTLVVLALGAVAAWMAWTRAADLGRVGADLALYLDSTRRWLDGGSFYPARQLAGPYFITDGDVLYPPTTILLFAAFLVLPAALFWAVPLGITAWITVRYRPAPWTWPLIALCLAYIPTTVKIVHGNPFIWATAAAALGTAYGWPSLLVLVKPSLAPFALVGIRHRSWWVGLVVVGVVAVLFAPLWSDYLSVLRNSRNEAGILYSLSDVPLMLVPLIAYVGRTRDFPARSAKDTPVTPAPARSE
jgi:hypothetical protein